MAAKADVEVIMVNEKLRSFLIETMQQTVELKLNGYSDFGGGGQYGTKENFTRATAVSIERMRLYCEVFY